MATELKTTSGSWLCPAGITSVTIECWGGGGAGGGGGTSNKNGGGGGAGGQYAIKANIAVTPGNSYNYYVGSGGVGAINADRVAGGDTYWVALTGYCTAKGGQGGQDYNNGAAAGIGSTTNGVGDTVRAGGSGSAGAATYSGAGGGGAGSTTTGDSAGAYNDPGTATSEYGGVGGAGTNANGAPGSTPGSGYGGGGGGATKQLASGSGYDGLLRITYTLPENAKFLQLF